MTFRSISLALTLSVSLLAWGCGDDAVPTGSSTGSGGSPTGPSTTTGAGQGGAATTTTSQSSSSGQGGAGGGLSSLEDLLTRLRADRDGTLLEESQGQGWPVLVEEGLVVVGTDPSLDLVAGEFDGWVGTALLPDQGFSYLVLPAAATGGYKFTDGITYAPDGWSRSYDFDQFGELSLISPPGAHLDRFFAVDDMPGGLAPRNVRVWVPAEAPTHVLYVADGQNLFDPGAIWGGWNIQASAPPGMLIVGIDNTPARMSEYTHVADDIGGGPIGGQGDAYATLLEQAVRPLVAQHYGEPQKRGLLGSSLGGLISLHIGYQNPSAYAFVGSMSGTVGWGSIGPHTGQTIIERYDAANVFPFVVFLDSGGAGTCADTDGDGIFDDGTANDNMCENDQLRDTLFAKGYVFDQNLHHWHEPGAPHNEAAWSARVFRPLDIFAAL